MPTIDKTKGGPAVPMMMDGIKRFQLYAYVSPSVSDCANGNVIQVLKVKKGMRVYGVQTQVVTAATGTTLTANVGDGDDDDGYDATINLRATGVHRTAIGTDAYGAAGKLYTADDTIDLTIASSGVTAAPVLKIWADCEYFQELS